MHDTQVVLHGDIVDRLVERAIEEGISPDELAGKAVVAYLGPRRRLGFAGIGHGKPGLYARDADLILQSSGYGR
ncbi:MAG TPA: hypothetical protein VHX40_03120 [Acidimicrobiales bacterium]|nr:hypothetical protein [Acidimicrobiales bacterium]